MSDDTTNNVDTTVAPATEEPVVSAPSETPESVPETTPVMDAPTA